MSFLGISWGEKALWNGKSVHNYLNKKPIHQSMKSISKQV